MSVKANDDTDEVPVLDKKGLNLKPKASLTSWLKLTVTALLFMAVLYGVFQYGKRSERRITWFSELLERTQGRRQYFMDFEVVCSNGKDIGRMQVDLNLTNGKVRIVRNDPMNEPNCIIDPAKAK